MWLHAISRGMLYLYLSCFRLTLPPRDFTAEVQTYLSPLLARTQASPHPAQLIEDIGYSCCASVASLKDLLQQFPKLKEQDVALIIGAMAKSHSPEGSSIGSSNFTNGDENFALPLYTSFSASVEESKDAKEVKGWDANLHASVFVDTVKELV